MIWFTGWKLIEQSSYFANGEQGSGERGEIDMFSPHPKSKIDWWCEFKSVLSRVENLNHYLSIASNLLLIMIIILEKMNYGNLY